jgi:hypothetical protein
VNIKPDIRDTIPHDPSPMHEARHRPIRRNPRYLHTARRVAPSLRRTCGLDSHVSGLEKALAAVTSGIGRPPPPLLDAIATLVAAADSPFHPLALIAYIQCMNLELTEALVSFDPCG